MEEQEYSTEENEEQDLTCGNPDCGCRLHKNSLSPVERDFATGVLKVLKATAEEERKYSQDN